MGALIASGNLKGGTGKTTIAVNLACALATRGLQVSVLDVDPQRTAWAWGRQGGLPVEIDAAPPIELHGPARWQQVAITLAERSDVAIVDLPPLIAPALAAALYLAELVLLPVTPSAVDVGPMAEALRLLRMTRETRPGAMPRALLVPNRVDHRGLYDAATQRAVESLHERWAPPVTLDTDFVNAYAAGGWVGSYAPKGRAAGEIETLADAVWAVLGTARRRARPVARPLDTLSAAD